MAEAVGLEAKRNLYAAQAQAKLKLTPEDAKSWADQKISYESEREEGLAKARAAYDALMKSDPKATDIIISDKIFALQSALGRVGEDHRLVVPGAATEKEAFKQIIDTLNKAYPGKDFPDLEMLQRKPKPFQSEVKQWTPEYVREEWYANRAQINEMLKDGNLRSAEDGVKALPDGNKVLENYREVARIVGLEPPPQLVIDMDDKSIVPAATSSKTSDGKDIIIINASALSQLSLPEQRQLWAHEFGHTMNRDTTADDVAQTHNAGKPELYRKKEFAADAHAAALGSPADTIGFLKKMKALAVMEFQANNPTASMKDFDAIYTAPGASHPSFDERVQRVEDIIKARGKDKPPAPQKPEQAEKPEAMAFPVAQVTTQGAPLQTLVLGGARKVQL
ncbi:MAG: hypothetical protein EBV03_01730 [Proteobacteria bacterium]|nr:hypothetical protein [Pseudomonadota bacterium]